MMGVFIMALPTFAQISPAQVWQDWQVQAKDFAGASVLGTVAPVAGNGLDIFDVVLRVKKDQSVFTVKVDKVELRQRGEAVQMTLSDEVSISLRIKGAPDSPPFTLLGSFTHPGLSQRITRIGSETITTTTAQQFDFKLLSLNDVDIAALGGRFEWKIRDLSTRNIYSQTADQTQSSVFTAAGLAVAAKLSNFERDFGLTYLANMTDLMGTSNLSSSQGDWRFDYSGSQSQIDGLDAGTTYAATSQSDQGSLSVQSDGKRLLLRSHSGAQDVTLSSGSLPLSVVVMQNEKNYFELTFPYKVDPIAQRFALKLGFDGLTVSPELWAVFDPQNILSQEPIGLNIDFGGKVIVAADLSNSGEVKSLAKEKSLPLFLKDFELHDLSLSALGARLKVLGNLQFDIGSKLKKGDQFLPTDGKILIDIYGLNATIDGLVAAGLLPEETVMGLRMMMGMFLRQANGEDHLTSSLSFANRGFAVNGMQIK
ncbi:MAG: hypothetical protein QMB16_05095 [Paracoccaceae bacterium]